MAASPKRYEQVGRAFKVLEILQASRFGRTIEEIRDEIVEHLGLSSLSTKSIDRDLKFWQAYGFHIEARRTDNPERRKVWRLMRGGVDLPSLQVTLPELLALAVGRDLIYPLAGTPYWSGIQSLWSKIEDALPGEVLENFERLRPDLVIRGPARKDYADKEGMLSAVNRAIYQNRVLEIFYSKADQTEPTGRLVQPYAIVLYMGNVYVAARDAEPRAAGTADGKPSPQFKLFKLDRLERVKVTDGRFQRQNLDMQKQFGHSIGVWHSDRPQKFVVRFAARLAKWVREAPFHPQQQIEAAEDGSVTVTVEAGHEQEILPRVLSLGADAQVVEPESCREAIRRIAADMVAAYG